MGPGTEGRCGPRCSEQNPLLLPHWVLGSHDNAHSVLTLPLWGGARGPPNLALFFQATCGLTLSWSPPVLTVGHPGPPCCPCLIHWPQSPGTAPQPPPTPPENPFPRLVKHMPRLLTPAAQVPLHLAGPTGPTGPGSGLPRVWRPSLTPGPSSSTRPSHSHTAPCPDLTHAHTRPPSRHAALLPTCVQTSYTQARRRGRACVAHCVHTHLSHTRALLHTWRKSSLATHGRRGTSCLWAQRHATWPVPGQAPENHLG